MLKPVIEWAWTNKIPNSNQEISDYLVPALSKESSCPFHKMGAFFSKQKSALDDVAYWHQKILSEERVETNDTISPMFRTCWGAQELFKNSLVLRAPTDLVISYDRNRRMLFRASLSGHTGSDESVNDWHGFMIHQHPIWQTELDDGKNILDNKIAIKLITPFKIKTKSKIITLTPSYHADTPWNILPGIVPEGIFHPNVFLEVELPPEGDVFHLQIKKGDPIAYFYFTKPHNLYKMKQVDTLTQVVRKTFLHGFVR